MIVELCVEDSLFVVLCILYVCYLVVEFSPIVFRFITVRRAPLVKFPRLLKSAPSLRESDGFSTTLVVGLAVLSVGMLRMYRIVGAADWTNAKSEEQPSHRSR